MKAEEHRKKLLVELEEHRMYAKYYIDQSYERGRALSTIIPLIRQEDLIELFAELWDLRSEKKRGKGNEQ